MCYRREEVKNIRNSEILKPTNDIEKIVCCEEKHLEMNQSQTGFNNTLVKKTPRKCDESCVKTDKQAREYEKSIPTLLTTNIQPVPIRQVAGPKPVIPNRTELESTSLYQKAKNKPDTLAQTSRSAVLPKITPTCQICNPDPVPEYPENAIVSRNTSSSQIMKSYPDLAQTPTSVVLPKNPSYCQMCNCDPITESTDLPKSTPTYQIEENDPTSQLSRSDVPSENVSEKKEAVRKQVTEIKDIFKPCDDCYKTHNFNLQKLFDFCEKDPDWFIEAYKNEYSTPLQEREHSQIISTDEKTLGNENYHYLMVDNSTNTSTDTMNSIEETKRDSVGEMTAYPTEEKNADPCPHCPCAYEKCVEHKMINPVDGMPIRTIQGSLEIPVFDKYIASSNTEIASEQTMPWSMKEEGEDEISQNKSVQVKRSNSRNSDDLSSKSFDERISATESNSSMIPINETPLFANFKQEMTWESRPKTEKEPTEPTIEFKEVELESEERKFPRESTASIESIPKKAKEITFNQTGDHTNSHVRISTANNDDQETAVSFIDLDASYATPTHESQLLLSKQRMEAKLAHVMERQKNLQKSSLLIDVVKEEKKKGELRNSLEMIEKGEKEDDEENRISENRSTNERTKCCGLIKTKKKLPNEADTRNQKKKSTDSISSVEEMKSRLGYKRRSSPIENPVYEKNEMIKRLSSNL